jgi:hypothetical protein
VEFPDNPSRDHQREKRESPSVELPGKLCEVKALDKGLPKKCRSRKIDLMFPDSGAKNVIAQYVLAQIPRQVRQAWRNKGVTYHCHLNRKPLSVQEYIKVTPRKTSPVT